MTIIPVKHSAGAYNIYVGSGILGEALSAFFEGRKYDRVFLVTDSNVGALYLDKVSALFEEAGRPLAGSFTFPAGETSKTLSTVSDMYEAFSGASLTRKSLIAALGGGVTGDMTGFAAATYLRGVDVLQIPTTLLSQIDSSIGGKTGVDLAVGKNLVGAFKQPSAVIADSDFLDTLPARYLDDGMGEAIKYGCIYDEALFEAIADKTISRADMIAGCMRIKAEVVEADEFEGGLRAILNFGHTLGHAVEKLGGFERFSHGESVGIGMLYAARIGAALGGADVYDRILSALEAWGLPTVMDYPAGELLSVVGSDKKRVGDSITFVMLERMGKAALHKVELSALAGLMS